jgi:hypothetical protein
MNDNMKKKIIYILPICLLLSLSCEQEIITLEPPVEPPVDTSCEDAVAGSLDFTKFVAIGNSFVAGFQAGALFTDGQDNSMAAILNKQFECVGAPATFNQPTIGAELGWNLFITQPFLSDGTSPIEGRLLLQYGDNTDCETGEPSPIPTTQLYGAGELEALPDPTFNPGFIYAGVNSELNNFSVPAITLGQSLIPQAGDWTNPNPAIGFTPFYARFASAPGTSTIIGDAASAGGSFFLLWLGLDDFFLHAAFGGDPTLAPLNSSGAFAAQYGAAIDAMLTDPNVEGVIGNFPDIFEMPHFTAVSCDAIPLEEGDVNDLNAGFAGYNTALDALIANQVAFGLTAEQVAEIETRKMEFEVSCNNKIMLIDETLQDLGGYFDLLGLDPADRAGLVPYEQVRQTTADDIIPLATGSILGTDGTFGVLGVSEPVGDRYVIIPTERDQINDARDAFNGTIQQIADDNSARLAFADVSTAMAALVTSQAAVYNGVAITPNIDPPTGIYSEDGAHFNTRGYAFISRTFISAINAKFGSTIPLTNIAPYGATALPIP